MAKKNNKKGQTSTSAPIRSRTFTFEIYPEWSFFNDIVAHMIQGKYAMILHDKDINEDTGEIKKPHVHVVLKYGGRRTLTSVQNEYKKYGLESRFCDTCNERAMLRYLIHLDNPEKHQYSKNEIDTNMKVDCETAWNDEISSEEGFRLLNDFIMNTERKITQAEMNSFALNNGLTKGLRSFGNQLNNARIEHNREFDYNVHDNKMTDVINGLQNRIAELEHNYAVSSEENMRLRGISIDDDRNDLWEGLDDENK